MNNLYGMYPAKILKVNANKTVQVSIEPYTQGASNGVTAKLAYPVGFDCKDTDLLIQNSPDCWVFFEAGQFKNPVVTFFRTVQEGAVSEVLRFRQKRIEFYADEILFDAKTKTTKEATHEALVTSNVDFEAQGISLIGHGHDGVKTGNGISGMPVPIGGAGGGGSGEGGGDGSGEGGGDGSGEGGGDGSGEGGGDGSGEGGGDGSGEGGSGKDGADGKSAYELEVDRGYTGTLDEYLDSLHGKDGADGKNGINGINGSDGADGKNGINGINGSDGINGINGKDGKDGDDSVIEFYTSSGLKTVGKVKFWQGFLTTNSSGAFTCDYSSAGFTEVPAVWANGIPKSGVAGQQIFVSCDVKNATKTECSGYISSSTVAVVLVAGALGMPTSDVVIYAMGI